MTGNDAEQAARETLENKLYGLCIPPFWVKKAGRIVSGHPAKLITVVGFPLGYQMTEAKMEEVRQALRNGADEIDLVMNISAFKSGLMWTKVELAKCAQYIHEQNGLLKIIIETGLLDDTELHKACTMAANAGADYVKTATGFVAGIIKPQTIAKMRRYLPDTTGIKASGGIKTSEQVKALIEAGADRIGTSSALNIMHEEIA